MSLVGVEDLSFGYHNYFSWYQICSLLKECVCCCEGCLISVPPHQTCSWSEYRLSVLNWQYVHLLFFTMFYLFFFFQRKGGFFVDLFVRVSNQVAVNMYKQLGYSVYRTVLEYYSASNGEPDEDAYGKCLFCLKLNGKVLMLSIPRVVCMGFVLVFFFRMRKI